MTTTGTAVTQSVKASSSSKMPPYRMARHAGLAESELSRVHWEESVASNSPDLNPLDCHIWGAMLEKYHKLSQNQDNWWVEGCFADCLGRAQESRTHKQGCGKFNQALDCLCGCQWLSSAVRVYFQVCILNSAPNKKAELMLKIRETAVCNSYGWAKSRSSAIAKRTAKMWLKIIKKFHFLKSELNPQPDDRQVQRSAVVLHGNTVIISVCMKYNNDGHFAIEGSRVKF